MEIKVRGTVPVLVGLERVGLLGLDDAIAAANDSGLVDREELVDRMMAVLLERNYIPDAAMTEYRKAVWRELARSRGEDITDLYSEIEVEVRAEAEVDAGRFQKVLRRVFARHELRPVASVLPPGPEDKSPQLRIANEVVVQGTFDPARISRAVGRQISDW